MGERQERVHGEGEGEAAGVPSSDGVSRHVVRRTQNGRFANGVIKVVSDMSAEERFTARSHRFRKKLRSFLEQEVGASWGSMGELHRDAANYAGCSSQCAARWIYQFTGPGQEFQIIETEDEYTIANRGGRR